MGRLSYAVLFGPLFAWCLLAKGIKSIVEVTEPNQSEKGKKNYLVEYKE